MAALYELQEPMKGGRPGLPPLDSNSNNDSFTLHGRTYALPKRPTVVICIDGFDPTYLSQGITSGILPTLNGFVRDGFHATADVAMPSFTNPNNVSIVTGASPAIHGIAGNYFLDRDTGKETMIVDDSLLRGSTILAEAARRGVRVAAVTAKDKLRRILAHDLTVRNGVEDDDNNSGGGGSSSICFSAECASDDTLRWLGRETRPDQYSADLSLFVLDAGVKILREDRADLLYLTLSDFVQHKHAPGSPAADAFMAAVDGRVGALAGLGAVVAVTGDHGMSDKSDAGGAPNVLFLQDELEGRFGRGCARVICPITDPFVKHHGALGSFVRVYVAAGAERADPALVGEMVAYSQTLPQVEVALLGEEAAERYEMPLDREGDFVVVAKADAVIGSRAEEHDLGSLGGHRLRSHGGLSEQKVPLLLSTAVRDDVAIRSRRWRNFDAFDLALNHQ
ncbi:Phosphonoacetate hydrolase [Pleurostoma richardsiae]|uniref:Phosphonoacetate hydrolase n=1 Tax=Pleurostoma richardsiae TaxID=41990 RepID=A0AA38VQ83_9PEZI|nr:Phosphonoacetate hydrolase [Pleurostoma richardsiae]